MVCSGRKLCQEKRSRDNSGGGRGLVRWNEYDYDSRGKRLCPTDTDNVKLGVIHEAGINILKTSYLVSKDSFK